MGIRGDKLRGILKRIHPAAPSHDFTAAVMREIEAMAEDKVCADEDLKSLLKYASSPAPPNAFTYKVLNTIREQTPVQSKPIISKGVWAGVLSFVTVCIIFAVISGTGDSSPDNFYAISLGDYLSNFFGQYTEIILYLVMALSSGSLLLLLDYLLNKKILSK